MVAAQERADVPALPAGHVLLVPQNTSWKAVADWMAAGLRRREQIIHAGAHRPTDNLVTQRLAVAHGFDVAALRSSGQLRSATVEEFYAPRDRETVVESALAEGYSGVRVCGAAEDALERLSVGEYQSIEDELNDLSRRYPFSVLCRYGQELVRDNQDLSVGRHSIVTDSVGCISRQIPAAAPHEPGQRVLARFGVELSGEFDLANTELLGSAVGRAADALPQGGTLALDLSAVSFFGLAAVRAILLATEPLRADGGTVVIHASGSELGRIFDLLDLTEVPGIRLGGDL